jgi:cytochrome c-type biogenesis protein CcmH
VSCKWTARRIGQNQFLVARYGEFVLLQPCFALHTLVLWIGPIAILALAAFAALKWRRPAGTDAPCEQALSADEARRLDDLMKRER